jgi:bacillithiol biosynthesis cysteine-adding enzyme BshC
LNTDDKRLKEIFKPIILDEIIHSTSKPIILDTQKKLNSLGYEEVTHVRDINMFYFGKGFRHRIERENSHYVVLNHEKTFDEPAIREEINLFPEKFSPNVILRPLYQEIILPNLAYVGGGGELSYWLERKAQFMALGIPYPMLVRRDSFQVITPEQKNIMVQFAVTITELAMRTDMLLNHLTEKLSANQLSLEIETTKLLAVMDNIKLKAQEIDPTLGPSIEGEKTKLLKSIEHVEKKMLKAEKSKLEVKLNKIKKLKEKLFPENGLQERKESFLTYYADYGKDFVDTLLEDFDPLDRRFKVIQMADKPE